MRRRRSTARGRRLAPASALAGGLLLALASAAGCERPPEAGGPGGGDEPIDAPVALRAGVVIEPDELTIGDTAWLEVSVVTPPGHALRPIPAPENVPGFWILEAELRPVRREPTRWVHATRFHVRARETGSFVWPAQTAVVEDPEGAPREVEIPARPLRVAEVSPEFAARAEPFPFRAPQGPRRPSGFVLPALLGAAATLLALAVGLGVHRARAARSGASDPDRGAGTRSAWRSAQAALEAALLGLEQDPLAAADAGSSALRRYVSRHYGLAAEYLTTEELAARQAPIGLGRRWPELLRLLRAFDAARFRPGGAAADTIERDELRAALRAAQHFVADATSRGVPPRPDDATPGPADAEPAP